MELRHAQSASDAREQIQRPLVGIIDYGAGNLRNVDRALKYAGADTIISAAPSELERADRLILPGVGAFKPAMDALRRSCLTEWILDRASQGVAMLGLCLGYQMLFERSAEFGDCEGLGIFEGTVKRFEMTTLAVPHVGWNEVTFACEHSLFEGLGKGNYFYFAHSFYASPADPQLVLGTTEYGLEFASIAGRGNVMGVQFHPEKSQTAGLRLLHNFVRMGGG